MPRLVQTITGLFETDLRALAVMRIGIGALLLRDLIQRSQDLVAHYTDFGLLPRAAMIENAHTRWLVSIHLMSGTWEVQSVLFVLAAIFALMVLVGYRTRAVTVISWFLFTSLCARNTVILAGDALLSALLFWAIFLPWGARFSLDKALHPEWDNVPNRYVSWATVAYLLQIVFVFWFGALMKTGPEWRVEGSAIYYALSIDQLVTPIGLLLLQLGPILRPLTFGVLWLESIGPLLLFSPIWTGPIRTAVVLALFSMLVGFGLCLVIGIFVWTAAFSVLGLLPFWFWEKFGAWWRRPDEQRIRIYYDGDCGYCTTTVRIMKGVVPSALILPGQNEPSIASNMQIHNSWLVMDGEGNKHYGFRAGVVIAEHCYLLRPLVSFLKFSWINAIGEKGYKILAKHRKVTCAVETSAARCAMPAFELGKVQSTLVALLLLYTFFWNVATIPNSRFKMSERVRSIGDILGLAQAWTMFTPYPLKDDGWYVIPGKLKNGTEVDLFRDGKEITWAKPALVSATYKNFRWQKYMMNLWRKDYRQYRPYYAQYLCRDWNAHHSPELQLEELQIYFVMEMTLPKYEYSTPEKVLLLRHRCGELNESRAD